MIDSEVKELKNRNYHKIRELIRISFGLGVNLMKPTFFRESLKIINVTLVICSALALYGNWNYTTLYFENLSQISESVCTAFQTIVSMFKMVYYLFVQRKLYILLNQAQTHELIRKIEIFQMDIPLVDKLKKIINCIMEKNWKNVRGQLIFYICCCIAIISNYFFSALFINLYHAIKKTPNYEHLLQHNTNTKKGIALCLPNGLVNPKLSSKLKNLISNIKKFLKMNEEMPICLKAAQSFPAFYPLWESKGMSFPYYEIQMFLGGCAAYIAGMCAVSFDGVFIVLCVHGVGLIQVLNAIIEKSTSPDVPKEKRVEYMRYCIFYYQRVYEYVLTLDNIFRHISLSQFMLSLIIWGIVLFQMSVGLESNKITFLRMILYLAACGYEIVIYCYNSQQLTNESEKIPLAFYNCEWYNESEEFKLLVRLMILRSNRIFKLNISWFTTMSLPTLLAMAKTSGSYFLLLRNLAE